MRVAARLPVALAILVVASACREQGTAVTAPEAIGLSASALQNANAGQGQSQEALSRAIIHRTVEAARASGGASTSGNLLYNGGVGGIGVETAPKIYLVLWGSQWNGNDPSGEAAILQSFYSGIGGSGWLNSVSQYCQGVATGTVFCSTAAGTPVYAGNQAGMLVAVYYDNATKAPSKPTQSQIAAEAVRMAQHFGNTTASSNASVQYVIATATGNNSSGFKTQYCAYHSSTSASVGNVAYTNLPYITDAGASCGANFNGLGPNAGITIVSGHEAGETITDQFPRGGWLDSGGAENGDKCAWTAATANVTFTTGTFPVQPLWSNAANGGAGGCVISYP